MWICWICRNSWDCNTKMLGSLSNKVCFDEMPENHGEKNSWNQHMIFEKLATYLQYRSLSLTAWGQLWVKRYTFLFVRYLSSPSLVAPRLSESLQTSSVKPGTSRAAQGVGTHMSLYQHPGEGRQVDRHTQTWWEKHFGHLIVNLCHCFRNNMLIIFNLMIRHIKILKALQKIYPPCVLFILQCNTLLDPIWHKTSTQHQMWILALRHRHMTSGGCVCGVLHQILWVLWIARWDLHGLVLLWPVSLNCDLGNLGAWSTPWDPHHWSCHTIPE